MSRTVSSDFRRAVLAAYSGRDDAPIMLLTIEHADLAATRRYARSDEDVVSDGDTYTARSFDIPLPADLEVRSPDVSLTLNLLGETLYLELRDTDAAVPPAVTLSFVRAGDPDTVEASFAFEMRVGTADLTHLQATLTFEPVQDDPFPAGRITPSTVPSAF